MVPPLITDLADYTDFTDKGDLAITPAPEQAVFPSLEVAV
jgi:hypothetical protein